MNSHSRSMNGGIALLFCSACTALLVIAFGPFKADATPGNHFEGTIMSAGASALMIQSVPDNDTVLFKVESKAAITKDGKSTTIEKLSNGDSVVVDSTTTENERIATRIDARSPY